jgi:hypothetical protein
MRQTTIRHGEKAEYLYRQGLSIAEAAVLCGLSYTSVRRLLVARGVEIRRGGWGKHQRKNSSEENTAA